VVVAARRTAFTTAGRALSQVAAADLAAPVLAALAAELELRLTPATAVDDVVLGNCCGPGGDLARVAALAAGLGVQVPGVTVDRQCGSGLDAVRLAGALVGSGVAEVVLAGGTESASLAGFARAAFAPPGTPDPDMGPAAEALAVACRVDRERQDAYAERSHARAIAMQDGGGYDTELVAVHGVRHDDRPRRGLTRQTLSRFRPAFAEGGSVTAGNACGKSDGAAVVAVVSERLRDQAGLPGLRILGSAVCGVDPALPGLGPVPAVRRVLAAAGVRLADVEVLEITEAFAAQVLACTDALGLDPLGADAERVCPQGGALALGHPWGASGAMLVVRLFSQLVHSPGPGPGPGLDPGYPAGGPRYGLACCAIGGGQGLAVLVERVG